jgi:hypothetical protein
MSLRWSHLAVAVLLAAVVLAVAVDPASAQQANNGGVGKGLGQMLQEWAKYLIPGVVALVGIPAIARHDFGMAVSIFIVAMLLGAFAFISVDDFQKLVQPVLKSLTP